MPKFKKLIDSIHPLPKEYILTANALGRVIAEPVISPISLPEHDIASADGYAISDVSECNMPLNVVAESSSAKPYKGILEKGHAVKMYAGGRLPRGAVTVVPFSKVNEGKGHVIVNDSVAEGENICPAGLDLAKDKEVLKAGDIINARLSGLASTAHLFWLPVVRRPRVAILAVGSELALPGEADQDNPITASSLYAFSANVTIAGGEPVILGTVADTASSIKEKIAEAKGCDLLFTTGATSLAAGNLMQKVLKEVCGEIDLYKVELNRNDCMIFGKHGDMPICAVPGNPISAQIYSTLFVKPIIRKLVGMPPLGKRYAVLGRNLDSHDKRVAYLHASLSVDSTGTYIVNPVSAQDGFLLSELAKADCLIVIESGQQYKKGDLIEVATF
jgi:molybdopterin molybdotransferase